MASKDIRIDVKKELDNQERSVSWLSKKTNIPYSTLYGILVHKIQYFDEDRLEKINQALNTSFKLPK